MLSAKCFMYFFRMQTDVRQAACARLSHEPTKRLALGGGECSLDNQPTQFPLS